jgi:two-component system response regulator FixJ
MNQTVFVVDDDDAVRDALTRLLEQAGFRVQAFASANAFLEQCSLAQAGCMVLDVRMPGLSGPELQEALAARGQELPIIFLTGHGDVATSVQTLKAGAYDFLEKPPEAAVLVDRVRGALELEKRERAAKKIALEARAKLDGLTEREREVLLAVVAGQSSKEIARRLGISYRTVEAHRAHVMQKTGADTIVQLVNMVETARRQTGATPVP